MGLSEDIERLEASIRQLQIEWDKFFGGVERRPPTALQARVEALVRQHANTDIRNATERFRYQNVTARFNTLNELWNKRLRALEEGRPLGVHGLRAQALPPPTPAPAGQPQAPAVRPQREEFRVADPARDGAALEALYERFAASRQRTGEPAVRFDTFRKLIAQQAQRLLVEKNASAVDFRIETKDGKVSLKAKPVK